METMFDRLENIEKRYAEISELLAREEVVSDPQRLQTLAQELASLRETVVLYRQYKEVLRSIEETKALRESDGHDSEMAALVAEELDGLESRRQKLLSDIKLALLPKDPADDKDVIVEIRAGTGGDEAALFAADLFNMYSRYALSKGWTVEPISAHETGIKGYKEIICEIKGKGAFSRLKYERGVHRVQRVPVTEAGGRIHTSTATVAVLPEMDEIAVKILPDDLKIDTYRSSGAGGQHVNKTSSAIRITHLPTGIVVTCQDERSQHKNKARAMSVLRARLYDLEQTKQFQEITETRRAQVGTAERSEKIRTYNFPQSRVTDHRIGLTLHNLKEILEGDLDKLIDALITAERPSEE